MKKALLLAFVFLLLFSCKDEEKRISDGDDWLMNVDFSAKEKKLFDFLDFEKTAVFEPLDDGAVHQPRIYFYVLGKTRMLEFRDGRNDEILNVVIVNNKFKKIITDKIVSINRYEFNVEEYKSGIYRIYYVIQDSNFHIIFKGYGDFLVE